MSSGNEKCYIWLISGCIVRYLHGLWVIWFVCGLADLRVICRWLVGSLGGLWVIWMVCGWFRVLQLTAKTKMTLLTL